MGNTPEKNDRKSNFLLIITVRFEFICYRASLQALLVPVEISPCIFS